MNLSAYRKAIPALILAFAYAAITAFQGSLEQAPIIVGLSILVAILNAFHSFQFANAEFGILKYSKAWANVLNVVAQGILALVATGLGLGDVSADQWSMVALSAVTAIATFIVPNEPELVFLKPSEIPSGQ